MSDVSPPPGAPEPVVPSEPVVSAEAVVTPPPAPPAPPAPVAPPAPPTYAAPPAYGAPAQGYNNQMPDNTSGTIGLVMGILGLTCIPLIGGILGVVFGRMGMKKAQQGLATNGGAAKAGFIMGIIGLVLYVIGIIFWLIFVVILAASSTVTTTVGG